MAKKCFICPSNWDYMKTQRHDKEVILYKGELPSYVLFWLEMFGYLSQECSNLSKDDLDNLIIDEELTLTGLKEKVLEWTEHQPTDEEGNPVGEVVKVPYVIIADWDSMFTEEWPEGDLGTVYFEANCSNICTTLRLYNRFCNKKLFKNLQALGYEMRIMLPEDYVPMLRESQVFFIDHNKYKDKIDLVKLDDNFAFPRVVIADPDANDNDLDTENEIDQIVSSVTAKTIEPFYRRYHLNEMLKRDYGDKVSTNAIFGHFDKCLISHPIEILPIARTYHYDRTDNWSARAHVFEAEQSCLKVANSISCSSKWLYNDTLKWLKENRPDDNVSVKYVPNGNEIFDYSEDVKKFDKKTAIYIGNRLEKVDLNILYLLCEINPDWNFMLYAQAATELQDIPDNMFVHELIDLKDLFPIICKCHAGLILLKNEDWTKGMLSNKMFNYINARIPTIFSGVPEENYEDYAEVAFNISDISSLDEAVEKTAKTNFKKYERSWDEVYEEVMSCIS